MFCKRFSYLAHLQFFGNLDGASNSSHYSTLPDWFLQAVQVVAYLVQHHQGRTTGAGDVGDDCVDGLTGTTYARLIAKYNGQLYATVVGSDTSHI